MDYVLINIILNAILVGVIVLTQFVTYPLFKKINYNFKTYHSEYTSRMGFVVAPLMILELIIVVLIISTQPINNIIKAIVVITALIWASTFLIQVPIHNKISFNKDTRKVNKLIQSNLIRTALWCAKLVLSILLI